MSCGTLNDGQVGQCGTVIMDTAAGTNKAIVQLWLAGNWYKVGQSTVVQERESWYSESRYSDYRATGTM